MKKSTFLLWLLLLAILICGCTEVGEFSVGDSLYRWRATYPPVGGNIMIDCLCTENGYVVMLTEDNRTISAFTEFSPDRVAIQIVGMTLSEIANTSDLLGKTLEEIVAVLGKPHARVSGLGTPTYVTKDACSIYLYSTDGWSFGRVEEIHKVDLFTGETVEYIIAHSST